MPESRRQILAALARLGVTGWWNPDTPKRVATIWTPLARLETSHAEGVLHYLRGYWQALRDGAEPCPRHPHQFTGHCPVCRRLWSRDPGP